MGKPEARSDEEHARDEAEAPQLDFGELGEKERQSLLEEVDASLDSGSTEEAGPEEPVEAGAGAATEAGAGEATAAEPEPAELDELLDEAGKSDGEESGVVGSAAQAEDASGPESTELDELLVPGASASAEGSDAVSAAESPAEPEPATADEPEAAKADEEKDEPPDEEKDEPEAAKAEEPSDEETEVVKSAEADAEHDEPLAEGVAKPEAAEPEDAADDEHEEDGLLAARAQVSEPPPPPKRLSKDPSVSATGTPLPHWSQRPQPHPPRPPALGVSLPRDPDLPGFESVPPPLGVPAEADAEAAPESEPVAVVPPQPVPARSGAATIAFLVGMIVGMVAMRAIDLFGASDRQVDAELAPVTPEEGAQQGEVANAARDEAPAAATVPAQRTDDESAPLRDSESSQLSGPLGSGPLPGPLPTNENASETEAEESESEEPEPEPEPPPPFDQAAAAAALSAAAAQASSCRAAGAPTGYCRVRVTFKETGQVTNALVVGPPYAGTPTGSCIARTMRAVTVPPFTGSAVTVSKTVAIR